jgi:hypothetical protein
MSILSLSIFRGWKHVGGSSEALPINFSLTAKFEALAFDGAARLGESACSPLTASGNSFATKWRTGNERTRSAKKEARSLRERASKY